MGDAQRGAPHGEVARQSHVMGVRYRLGPPESLPRCWIGGRRMHLLDEITHPTRAIGEVAAAQSRWSRSRSGMAGAGQAGSGCG